MLNWQFSSKLTCRFFLLSPDNDADCWGWFLWGRYEFSTMTPTVTKWSKAPPVQAKTFSRTPLAATEVSTSEATIVSKISRMFTWSYCQQKFLKWLHPSSMLTIKYVNQVSRTQNQISFSPARSFCRVVALSGRQPPYSRPCLPRSLNRRFVHSPLSTYILGWVIWCFRYLLDIW